MSSTFVPERGDAVWIDLNPQAGHEQSGRRPAVVLSPSAYNGLTGLLVLCPVTSRVKGYPFEVAIPPGLAVSGVILADQVRSVDWRARRADFVTKLPASVVEAILQKLQRLL